VLSTLENVLKKHNQLINLKIKSKDKQDIRRMKMWRLFGLIVTVNMLVGCIPKIIPYYSIEIKERENTNSTSRLYYIETKNEKRINRKYAIFVGKDNESEPYVLITPYIGGYSSGSATIYQCDVKNSVKIRRPDAEELIKIVDASVKMWSKRANENIIEYARFISLIKNDEKREKLNKEPLLYWIQRTERGSIAVLEFKGRRFEFVYIEQVKDFYSLLKKTLDLVKSLD